MNISQAINNRIAQLYSGKGFCIHETTLQAGKEITLDALDVICEELQITIADFFNSDIFRNLERS